MNNSLSESSKSLSSNNLSLQFNLSGIDNLQAVSKHKDLVLEESISEDSDQELYQSKKHISIQNGIDSIPKDLLNYHKENRKPSSHKKTLNPLFKKIKSSNSMIDQDIKLILKDPEDFAERFITKYEYSDIVTHRRDRIKTAICNAVSYINDPETLNKSTQTDKYLNESCPTTPVSLLKREFSSLASNEIYPKRNSQFTRIDHLQSPTRRNSCLLAQKRLFLFNPIDSDINNNDLEYQNISDTLPLIIENDISPTTSICDKLSFIDKLS